MSKLLLQLQSIDIRKTELGGGNARRPLKKDSQAGENSRHAGRRQENIVRGAPIKVSNLLAEHGLNRISFGGRTAPFEQCLGMAAGHDQSGVLPKRPQSGQSFVGSDYRYAFVALEDAGIRTDRPANKCGSLFGGLKRGKR
jgi:hypothetical protein